VQEQLATWLRQQKKWDVDLAREGFTRRGGRELLLLRHANKGGRSFHARLTEHSRLGEWRTALTLHLPRKGDGWVLLRVSNDRDRFVKVPWLATYLTQVIELRDGGTALTSVPELSGEHRIDALLDSLCDPDREGLVVVAGTNDQLPPDRFRDQLTRWTLQMRGLAQVVVLDPRATRTFRETIGDAHAVRPWTLRTYLPEVDPAVEVDARRHRVLSTRTLAGSDESITDLLGRVARANSSRRLLPTEATAVLRVFTRLEDALVVDALSSPTPQPTDLREDIRPPEPAEPVVSPRPPVDQPADTRAAPAGPDLAEEVTGYLAQVELVKSVLGVPALDERTLREIAELAHRNQVSADSISRVTMQLAERQQRIAVLEDENARLQRLYDDETLDRAITEDQLGRLEDEQRWLRKRLAELEDYQTAYAPVPDTAYTTYPESFEDLVDRLGELVERGVRFTGDPDKASCLDDHDSLGKLARAAWDALLVLVDYVAARAAGRCSGGVDTYLADTPTGYRQLPAKRHGSKETRKTMDAWGGERVFPVPVEVSPSGRAVMEAHFKLGRVGMISPRLYYLDRWTTTGAVYVGYLGAHLTNTKTN